MIRDSGFDIRTIKFILVGDSAFRDGEDLPSTSSSTANTGASGFSIQNHTEVSPNEIKDVEKMICGLENRAKLIESEPMDEESLCTICYAHEISVMFNPCKHTSCRSCINQQMMIAKECFFCKQAIEDTTPVAKNDGK